jgi:hypothetical protein
LEQDTYSLNSDIGFRGVGPGSTTATAKLRKLANSVVSDSVIFETDPDCAECVPEPGAFEGEFDITGQWPTGTHEVEIWVNGAEVFEDRFIFIQ